MHSSRIELDRIIPHLDLLREDLKQIVLIELERSGSNTLLSEPEETILTNDELDILLDNLLDN